MTELEDFLADLQVEIKTTAETDGEGSTAAFVKIIMDYLHTGDILSDEFSPAFFRGTGKRNRSLRIDGYEYAEIDNSMTLVVADYVDVEQRDTLTKTEAEKHFEKVCYFLEEVIERGIDVEESTPVSDLVDYLSGKNRLENIQKFRIFLLTNTKMSSRIKELQHDPISGIPVELQVWGVDRVYEMVFSSTGRENIDVDFMELSGGIPCIEAHGLNASDYRSYLCVIPGNTLADIYDKYGGRLLEENVRMFLTNKSGVNKKIRATIKENPEKFFAYNNGISVTVRDITIEERDGGKYITHTDDFQIINGGQTTASLSQARYKDKYDLSSIQVPMKLTWLIDTDPDKVSQLVRNISYSANSQNKVTDADFFSSHPYHQIIERHSRQIYAPATGGMQHSTQWYYERVRGQYQHEMARMSAAEKKKFKAKCPDTQKFDKNVISKVRNIWDMKPDVVSKGAAFNLNKFADAVSKTWEEQKDSYDDKYFKESVALLILFKDTDKMIPKQEWYSSGYKANLVAYSISLFHYFLETQYPKMSLNLMYIWNKQEVPDVIKRYIQRLSELVYYTITDEDRPTENVTQWCKQQKCWESVKNSCVMQIGNDIEPFLVPKV